jgi:hypothetical protein
MEAARTSETSPNFYQTARRNTPDDSRLHKEKKYWVTTTDLIGLCLINFIQNSSRDVSNRFHKLDSVIDMYIESDSLKRL